MNENEMRDVFRAMREEPAPADSLARVRAAVDQRKRSSAPWKILALLAAAACLVAGFVILRPGKPVPKAVPVEIARTLPATAAAPEISVPPAPKAKRARRPRPVESVPVSIRIETPDPDVVILLVN